MVTPGLSGLAQVSGGYDLLPKEKVLLDFWQDDVEEAGVAEGQQGVSAKPICSSRCGFCHVLQLTRLPTPLSACGQPWKGVEGYQ